MKRTINYLFAAITLIAAASCTKDIQPNELNEGQSELRTIELSFEDSGITKVGVSDRTPQWQAGDKIWLSNGTNSEEVTLASEDITANVAKISTTLSGTLYAVYPASAQNGVFDDSGTKKIGFKIPTSTDGTFGNAHISVAEGTTFLTFKNVVSILKITTETATKLVNISSASAIAGEFKVTYSNVAVEPGTNQSKSINIFSSATGEKYVAVPSGLAFSALEFTVVGNINATDWATKKSTTNTATTGINTLYDLGSVSSWELSYITNCSIWAKFSVASGTQVRFSKGNLYCKRSSSSSSDWTWGFYANQYQYNSIATTSGSRNAAETDTEIDLFCWGSKSTDPVNNTSSSSASDIQGTAEDWGFALASNLPTVTGGWKTLTSAEWGYLLNTRTDANRFAKATVNSIAGLILFPDSYAHPVGVPAPTKVNDPGTFQAPVDFTVNSYTSDDWTKMESAGCVFLPAAGYRYDSEVLSVGLEGAYWSSTPYDTYRAYYLNFHSYAVNPAGYGSRGTGSSVRLVCAAQ